MNIFSICVNVAGGLGLFLLGMSHLSEGLQTVAGQRLRKMIASVTNNRISGVFTGTVVTGVVQSSSVVTVMIVGLVTAGLMTLNQAINVIIGANIGTTVTAWLIASLPKIGDYGLPVIAFSALLYIFAKRESIRYTGMALLGFGLVFYGLQLMNEGLSPLQEDPAFRNYFALFHADSVFGLVKCVLAGLVLTAVIQSSSAATAISINLAFNGLISFETAAALVFGMNIGTTVTAWLASLGATTEARRAALAHTLFNSIGVVLMLPFFLPFIVPAFNAFYPDMNTAVIAADGTETFPHIMIPIAMMHTMFNVTNTIIFLPFVTYLARLVRFLVPDPKGAEHTRLTVLDPSKLAPVFAVEQARSEVENMSDVTTDMLARFRGYLSANTPNPELEDSFFKDESTLDLVQHQVSTFLGTVMSSHLSRDVAARARMLLRVADEYESVSDDVVILLKNLLRMRGQNLPLPDTCRAELLQLHDRCTDFHRLITEGFKRGKQNAPGILANIRSDAAAIDSYISATRNISMKRISDPDDDVPPLSIVAVMDMLNSYRLLKENCLNIGEAMLDETAA